MDQLIVGTPKWGTMSSDSQGLDFENWREGEREGTKGLAAVVSVCDVNDFGFW